MQIQIPQNWQKVKLEEITEKIYSGGTPNTTIRSYWNGRLNWLSSGETGQRFIYDTKQKITEEGVKNSSTKLAKKGDVVIASAGQGNTRGQVSYLKTDTYINQSVICVRGREDVLDSSWIFYNLSNRYKELRIISDTTSIRGSLTTKIFNDLDILFPVEIKEQQKVVSILSAFDDKIEINNKIAKTLEQMAQNIFKEWFVKFRFPGHEKVKFVDSELGKIPERWKASRIKDVGTIITGKTPLTENKENFGSEFPFITIPDINKIFITKTERCLSKISAQKMKNLLLPKDSICVSCIATVGLVGITTEASFTNQQINSMIPKTEELLYFLFLYFKNKKKDLILYGSGGTATLIINKTKFENLGIIIPEDGILEKYHKIVNALLGEILSKDKENQKLAAMRDLFLPKLIRGEIRV